MNAVGVRHTGICFKAADGNEVGGGVVERVTVGVWMR